MGQTYTATIMRDDDWWIGWVEEVNGANAQERTREELLVSLRYAETSAFPGRRQFRCFLRHYATKPNAVDGDRG